MEAKIVDDVMVPITRILVRSLKLRMLEVLGLDKDGTVANHYLIDQSTEEGKNAAGQWELVQRILNWFERFFDGANTVEFPDKPEKISVFEPDAVTWETFHLEKCPIADPDLSLFVEKLRDKLQPQALP